MQKTDKQKYYREGATGSSVGVMVTLVIGVVIITIIIIMGGVLSGQAYQVSEPLVNAVGNQSVANESVTLYTGIAQRLTHGPTLSGSYLLKNASNTVPASNYSVTSEPSSITLLDNAYNGSTLKFSYDYGDPTIMNQIKDSVKGGFSTLKTTSDYLPLVILGVVLVVVLGLVLVLGGGFTGGRNNSAL
ncbi:MAG: hypothetical protein [Siphoviridae sp. ctjeG17]|nr:MAG: hypothetical protein [Siphoviridae sp. ctjeG17]